MSAVLGAAQAAIEARMRDTCRITAPGTGSPVFDPNTGQYTDPAATVVYEGKCRIPSTGGGSTRGGGYTVNGAAEQSFGVGEFPFEIPAGVTGVEPGQTVTYLTAPDNPALEGRVFGIVDPLWTSAPTRLRFRIKTAVSD